MIVFDRPSVDSFQLEFFEGGSQHGRRSMCRQPLAAVSSITQGIPQHGCAKSLMDVIEAHYANSWSVAIGRKGEQGVSASCVCDL